jgi:class 3 adenylate cyclase
MAQAGTPTDARILIVDDEPANVRLLERLLQQAGFARPASTTDPRRAAALAAASEPDLVLLDLLMPDLDGYAVLAQLRAQLPAGAYLPVVVLTADATAAAKQRALAAGATDFLTKPFDATEVLLRIKNLLQTRALHLELQRQNRALERRVHEQVEELERLGRLRRFLSPQVADLIVASGEEALLESHRREITVLFFDLRGSTALAETAEPEELLALLREYHAALGELVFRFGGTVEHFAGDGLMVFFNDPLPCPDPTARAVRLAVAARERVGELAAGWRKRGHDLALGVGIAVGYATLGRIGFEGRYDYGAVGRVTILASRLSDVARAGQVLLSQRAYAAVEDLVQVEPAGALTLKGFSRPEPAFSVVAVRDAAA